MRRQEAILLLGPTGSGKTPLGDWLQAHGLCGCRCHHFDFGANLREIAAARAADGFTQDEVRYIRELVEKGALLENETFCLALRILEEFIRHRQLQAGDLLVMNGLPRHAGQADAIAPFLKVLAIVHLQCSAEVVLERLQRNSGGDRTHRIDDTLALVQRKMATFAERTQPLLRLYQEQGVPVIPVAVKEHTRPAEVCEMVQRVWVLFTSSRPRV
jgi:adenylate kinase